MSEVERLLNELKSMKQEDRGKHIANTRDVWQKIGSKESVEAGFDSESELMAWLDQNDYSNIA